MRNFSRFIPGEEVGAVAQWRFGSVNTDSILMPGSSQDAEQVEVQRQQGFAEGFVQGRAQGLLEAQRQINDYTNNQGEQAARQFAMLLQTAHAQLDEAEQMTAQGVLELACDLARQVLRHEISSNPNVLLPVIREALGLLFADHRAVQVRLNPLDLDVLQDIVSEEFRGTPLSLKADPSIERGGCLVESGGTVIDGRIEKRWARTVNELGQSSPWEVSGDGQ